MDYKYNKTLGIEDLLVSSQVTMSQKFTWLKAKYSIIDVQKREILVAKSQNDFRGKYHVKDTQGEVVAVFRMHMPFFKASWMEVAVGQMPIVKVRVKSGISRSFLLLDEYDQQILKIRPYSSWGLKSKYHILGKGDFEIGSVKRGNRDTDFVYPPDLDIRYKAALLATIIYSEILETNASSST